MKHNCLYCNKEFRNKPLIRYCSRHCYNLAKRLQTKQQVEANKAINYRQVKAYLLERYGNICSICKLEKWLNKPIPLVLDHKDGNYMNNALNNCRLVCHNCDAQLPTYKNKNKGNGRLSRRKSYKENKEI